MVLILIFNEDIILVNIAEIEKSQENINLEDWNFEICYSRKNFSSSTAFWLVFVIISSSCRIQLDPDLTNTT